MKGMVTVMNTKMSVLSKISKSNANKILFLVVDGLGGMYHPYFGNKTELQYANIPKFDEFASSPISDTGLLYPVFPGIIPGSGSGHFGLFGYDPTEKEYMVGRGALEAADLEAGLVKPSDIVARFNFCSMNEDAVVTDRRAGRISSGGEFAKLIGDNIRVDGFEFEVVSTKEYRGVLIIRDNGKVSQEITDTDPQSENRPLSRSVPRAGFENCEKAIATAGFVNAFSDKVVEFFKGREKVNGLAIRGFSVFPVLPKFNEVYSVKSIAIASFPFYRGIAYLLGMDVAGSCVDFDAQIDALKKAYGQYDFFFLHYKDTDCKGEDKDFIGKVKALEELDSKLGEILELGFDNVVITGDHSTPSLLGRHSHHPVPLLIRSKLNCGHDRVSLFDEESFQKGSLGIMHGADLMTMVLAVSDKLLKSEDFI